MSNAALNPQHVCAIGCTDALPRLEAAGFTAHDVARLDELLHHLEEEDSRALVVRADSIEDQGRDVEEFVREARERASMIDVLVWAPGADARLVRAALRSGASDVILDPDPEALARSLRAAVEGAAGGGETPAAFQGSVEGFEGLLSRSPTMLRIFETAMRVAPTEATVLLLGETGTGKELLARAIHKHSGRKGRFVAINCGAVPETLIDSELFGYEKGSFTGASGSKTGLFRHADKGTLFLDEVGDLSASAQLSLLRAIQEGKVRPVGGREEVPVDVRVIAATSTPLDRAVREGRFREDLLYRLDVIRVVIPPLRERKEDVAYLFEALSRKLSEHHGIPVPAVSRSFMRALEAYPWPGNVRQLENFIERLILTRHQGYLTARDFEDLTRPYERGEMSGAAPSRAEERRAPPRPAGAPGGGGAEPAAPSRPMGGGGGGFGEGSAPAIPARPVDPAVLEKLPDVDLSLTLEEFLVPVVNELERRYIEAALQDNEGRVQQTARKAGVSRRTLQRKLKQYRIDKRQFI